MPTTTKNRADRRREQRHGPGQLSLAHTIKGRLDLQRCARRVVARLVDGLDVESIRTLRRYIDRELDAVLAARRGR